MEKKGEIFTLRQVINYGFGQLKENCVIATASNVGLFKLSSGKIIVGAILLII